MEWISVKEKKPEFINGKDYSENVLAIVEGYKQIQVMCYGYYYGMEVESGYYWASCNGDINGEAEWDDDYIVTHWMPLPSPPAAQDQ